MAGSLTFTIQPYESGVVSLGAFMRSLERVRAFVQAVDYAVSGEPNTSWLLVGLTSSAPTITIAPPPNHDPQASLKAIAEGLLALTRSEALEPPPYFTDDALDGLRAMLPLFGRGKRPLVGAQRMRDEVEHIKQIDFSLNGSGMTTVDEGIETSINRVLRGSYSAQGSIEGNMERINLRRRSFFTIWDRVSDLPVKCFFPREPGWIEKVRNLLDERVLVQGTVHYFRNGRPRYVNAKEIIDRTPNPDLPVAYFGCIPDLTAGLETEEYLRRLREGTLGEG